MTERLKRINELAAKSRTPQGLTDAERTEQQRLRREYVAAVRANVERQLEATRIVEPDGTQHPLRKKGEGV